MSRISIAALAAVVALTVAAGSSAAQSISESNTMPGARSAWELLFSSGALIPTGTQRRVLKDAMLSTGQLSYVVAPRIAVTSTLGWARSRDLAAESNPKLSVFSYDLGVEARAPRWRSTDAVSFTPFAGVGGGGRSLDPSGANLRTTHGLAGYAAVGGELAVGRGRIRLEARDYVTSVSPATTGRSARNDVSIIAGVRLVRSGAAK